MNSKSGQFVVYLISALLGCLFLFSAYSKTEPIQYFEYTLISQLPLNNFWSSYFARFFIGLEAALGLLLLINVFGKGKWVVKAAFLLTLIFTIHLVLLYFNLGNDVNCGCMGSLVPMSPLMSILKNLGIMALLVLIWRYSKTEHSNGQHWLASLLVAILVLVPFVLFPQKSTNLPVEKLYDSHQAKVPEINLRSGKHFVGFMSLTCPHCMDATKVLLEWKEKNPSLPIFIVFASPDSKEMREELFANFEKVTHFKDLPYSFLDTKTFMEMAGTSVPAMFWLDGPRVVRTVNVPDLNQKEFELWLKK